MANSTRYDDLPANEKVEYEVCYDIAQAMERGDGDEARGMLRDLLSDERERVQAELERLTAELAAARSALDADAEVIGDDESLDASFARGVRASARRLSVAIAKLRGTP